MKSFVFTLTLVFSMLAGSISASAQYSDPVYRRGADFYRNGEKLTSEQVASMLSGTDGMALDDIMKYQKGFRTGKGLLIGFGSLTGAGLVTLGVSAVGMMVEGVAFGIGAGFLSPLYALGGESPDISYDSKFRGAAVAGLCAAGAGVLGIVAGTTVLCINKKHLNRVEDACNGGLQGANLAFGTTENGIGLKLEF